MPPLSPNLLSQRHNDLTAPAQSLVPEIGAVLEALSATSGCLLARLSGSGATCFAPLRRSGAGACGGGGIDAGASRLVDRAGTPSAINFLQTHLPIWRERVVGIVYSRVWIERSALPSDRRCRLVPTSRDFPGCLCFRPDAVRLRSRPGFRAGARRRKAPFRSTCRSPT